MAAATKWNCLLFGVFIEKKRQRRPQLPYSMPDYVYNDDDDDAGAGAELELWLKDVASDNENKSK